MGSPGSWSGLPLRASQCATAGAAFATMAVAYAFDTSGFSAFRHLMYTMLCQFLWSSLLACLDIFSLRTKTNLQIRPLLVAITFGDWGMAVLTFAASSSSAGVALFFERDTNLCQIYATPQLCSQYKMSVVLAFMTWSFSAASAASLF